MYCDFCSVVYDEDLKKRYLGALLKEMETTPYAGSIETLYIGGGTPSLLAPSEAEALINKIEQKYTLASHAEVSLEVNPGTVDLQKVKALRSAGINRLSIGVQSMDPAELKLLGRVHDDVDSRNVLEWTGRYFDNFSVDIIYGIPGQEVSGLKESLEEVLSYSPPHVSAYELTAEEGTPLYRMLSEGRLRLPDDDDKIAMYELLSDILVKKGYLHYEISNYSRRGRQCRHNMNYWLRGEYLGFGAAAHAFVGNTRMRNTAEIPEYIRMIELNGSAVIEELPLTSADKDREEIFLGLRTETGIRADKVYGARDRIRLLAEEGLVLEKDGFVRLTEKGMLLSNRVIVEMIDAAENEAAGSG
ncbi:MAG: radical SAM family heme chaperone HemW [Nitrospirae bacterium]|nr:radical SAM family heme chaperone HemW [Nitrospirota bacterium]